MSLSLGQVIFSFFGLCFLACFSRRRQPVLPTQTSCKRTWLACLNTAGLPALASNVTAMVFGSTCR